MKIYTKTGDQGTTSLYGGKRVEKYNLRIESYGSIDELNSFLGLLRDQNIQDSYKNFIVNIQTNLFNIGAVLATPDTNTLAKLPKINHIHIQELEQKIDEFDKVLEPMTHFILPGGHQTVSYCHICRTICRRVERLVFKLSTETEINSLVTTYLNRLSDFLFVLARMLSKDLSVEEIKWIP